MASNDDDIVFVGPTSGLTYHNVREDWAGLLEELEFSSFPSSNPDELCHEAQFAAIAREFPEGGFVAFDDGIPVAMGVGIRKHFDFDHPLHTLMEMMPAGVESGHEAGGLWYYGTSIAVHPSHRRRGIGNELYGLRKSACKSLNLAGIVAGGVIPGFANHKDAMSANEYIDAVRAGELVDPTLTFQLANGFEAICALPGYLADPKVDNYATLIVWHNPDFVPGAA